MLLLHVSLGRAFGPSEEDDGPKPMVQCAVIGPMVQQILFEALE